MAINQLNNGDSGLAARTIINNLVNVANTTAGFPYTGSANVTGSVVVTGSVTTTQGMIADVFIHPQTIISNTIIPPNHNGFLTNPVGISGSMVVAANANLTILPDDSISSSYAITSISSSYSTYAITASYTLNTADIVTYSFLSSSLSSGTAKANSFYLIADFRTVHKVNSTAGTDLSGSIEPLLVQTLNNSTLSPIAYSIYYPRDIIHYSIIDDTFLTPFTSSNSKGVIVYRKDTSKNLETHYDWRNVKYRRWERIAGDNNYFWRTNPSYYVGSGGQSYYDAPTFFDSDGGNNTNCSIGPNSWNIVLGEYNTAIEIGPNCGAQGTLGAQGIDIGLGNDGIRIEANCGTAGGLNTYSPSGIYIGNGNRYINIGQRSYSVYIGDQCYAINLGTQQSDVVIPSGTWRGVMFKGFSNFQCTVNISGLTSINFPTLSLLSGGIQAPAYYCGIINLTSTNPSESIYTINDAIITAQGYSPYRLVPSGSLKVHLMDRTTTGSAAPNFNLGRNSILIDGAKDEYAILQKYMYNSSPGLLYPYYHLEYTNSSQFFATSSYALTASYAPSSPISLQQVLDYNHDLTNGNNYQGTQAGVGNVGTQVIAIGESSSFFNSGSYVNAIGSRAAFQNSGSNVVAIGTEAARANVGSVGVIGIGNGAAQSNTQNYVIGIGVGAAQNNTGLATITLGFQSGLNNKGSQLISLGYQTAVGNIGSSVIALGSAAANLQSGSYVNAIGGNAADRNRGDYINAIGQNAGQQNTGSYVNAIGHQAAYPNSGNTVNAIGRQTAYNNSGDNLNAIGYVAGYNNSGSNVIAIGTSAAYTNQGSDVIAFGSSAAMNNSGSNVIAFGNTQNNPRSNSFIIDNNYLPSYADYSTALADISTNGIAGCTYLYHDQSTNSVGTVRL